MENLRKLLRELAEGKSTTEATLEKLRHLPFTDLGFAKVDHHRPLRCGQTEVLFCQGKSLEQIKRISQELLAVGNLIATRAGEEEYLAIKEIAPKASFYPEARIVMAGEAPKKKIGDVLVITAGTADLPVAEEAAVASEILGSRVRRLYDVGVAGVHRLLAFQKELARARVIVAVAGMEGALPSLVAGLVKVPVIAVPTSVGYGASYGGLAALLAMLNSCAPGVAVVNIDNGFGGGYLANLINQRGG